MTLIAIISLLLIQALTIPTMTLLSFRAQVTKDHREKSKITLIKFLQQLLEATLVYVLLEHYGFFQTIDSFGIITLIIIYVTTIITGHIIFKMVNDNKQEPQKNNCPLCGSRLTTNVANQPCEVRASAAFALLVEHLCKVLRQSKRKGVAIFRIETTI